MMSDNLPESRGNAVQMNLFFDAPHALHLDTRQFTKDVIIKHPMYVGMPNIFLNEMCVRR